MPTLTLPQIGRRIAVAPGQTVLEAALEAGVGFPQLPVWPLRGLQVATPLWQVEMGEHIRFALSDAERASGQILACRAVPKGDVTVAWLGGEDAVPAHPVVGNGRRYVSSTA